MKIKLATMAITRPLREEETETDWGDSKGLGWGRNCSNTLQKPPRATSHSVVWEGDSLVLQDPLDFSLYTHCHPSAVSFGWKLCKSQEKKAENGGGTPELCPWGAGATRSAHIMIQYQETV